MIDNNFCDEFDAIVSSAIEFNLKNRSDFLGEYSYFPIFGAMNFFTVRINLGRRTGKTTYIKRYAAKNSALVVTSLNKPYSDNIYKGCNVVGCDDLLEANCGIYKKYDIIFFDEAKTTFLKFNEYDIYSNLVNPLKHQLFIQLG